MPVRALMPWPGLRSHCVSPMVQAAEKLVLAEGSKMAVAAFQGSHDQGVYGLVNGLGSIVVRTLFQPFEEAAFAAFSKERGECLVVGGCEVLGCLKHTNTVRAVQGNKAQVPPTCAARPAC